MTTAKACLFLPKKSNQQRAISEDKSAKPAGIAEIS